MARVTWTDQALDDLDAICRLIARDSRQYAQRFFDRVFRTTDRLAQFPLSGRVVPEFNREDVREVIVHGYRVIYRVLADDEVEVLTVRHGARRLESLNGP